MEGVDNFYWPLFRKFIKLWPLFRKFQNRAKFKEKIWLTNIMHELLVNAGNL